MFFKDVFLSIADCMESKFKGSKYLGQNNADLGENAEIFVKEFLHDSLSSNLKIFRGGKIVNCEGKESSQIDVLVCSNNSITLFKDKGKYPVETVYGAFSITSNLHHKKLELCIKEFESIPKESPKFDISSSVNAVRCIEDWNNLFPYKCIWAFEGELTSKTVEYLEKMISDNPESRKYLPDLIVVNKKAMIQKTLPGKSELVGGGVINKNFHLTIFEQVGLNSYWIPLTHILSKLYIYSGWQHFVTPKYEDYFNKDLEDFFQQQQK